MSAEPIQALRIDGEGNNGATVFYDTGQFAKPITTSGNTVCSNAQKPWGTTSIYFDGNGDFLTVGSTGIAMYGDFTLRALIYITALGTYQGIIDCRSGSNYTDFSVVVQNVGGTLRLDFINAGGAGIRLTCTSTAVPLNTWVEVSIVRANGTLMAFVGGVKDATTKSYSAAIVPAAQNVYVGKSVDPYYLNGHVKYVLLEIGIARWTSNYTPGNSTPAASVKSNMITAVQNLDSIGRVGHGTKRLVGTTDRLGVLGSYRTRLYDHQSGRFFRAVQSDASGNYAVEGVDGTRKLLAIALDDDNNGADVRNAGPGDYLSAA